MQMPVTMAKILPRIQAKTDECGTTISNESTFACSVTLSICSMGKTVKVRLKEILLHTFVVQFSVKLFNRNRHDYNHVI